MAKGFSAGLFHGVLVSGAALIALSLGMPLEPPPKDAPAAPLASTTPAPETNAESPAAMPREPVATERPLTPAPADLVPETGGAGQERSPAEPVASDGREIEASELQTATRDTAAPLDLPSSPPAKPEPAAMPQPATPEPAAPAPAMPAPPDAGTGPPMPSETPAPVPDPGSDLGPGINLSTPPDIGALRLDGSN
ncbi:hypothetical protein [Paracoccus ravus]|uniref:hypothetical protein n=1 Tax=Paracoccus ravus TaxID=2447760 RepID=UPI00106E62D8|nr:hypothetical protein [Paracoccus ravus]